MDLSNIFSNQVWGLVDADSFFAACEVYRNPKLRGKPVCVGRDIVIACTYEAKYFGIKTGTPIWEVKRLFGDKAIILDPDHRFYSKISSRLMSFLGEFSNEIEQFSIDEAFIQITGLDKVYHCSYEDLAEQLKEKILQNIGIPVSIGISNTRILAKIFAKINKPFGSFVLFDQDKIDKLFQDMKIKEIPFIGPKSVDKLKYIAPNIYEFKLCDHTFINKILGGGGVKIWLELNGITSMDFKSNEFQKGITRSRSFNPYFTNDKEVLFKYLVYNFQRAYEQLINDGLKLKYLKVFLRKRDFSRLKEELIFPQHTDDRELIFSNIKKLYENIFDSNFFYRSTGVVFGELKNDTYKQENLFDENSNKKNQLRDTINNINKKYGSKIVGTVDSIL